MGPWRWCCCAIRTSVDVFSSILDCSCGGFPLHFLFGYKGDPPQALLTEGRPIPRVLPALQPCLYLSCLGLVMGVKCIMNSLCLLKGNIAGQDEPSGYEMLRTSPLRAALVMFHSIQQLASRLSRGCHLVWVLALSVACSPVLCS